MITTMMVIIMITVMIMKINDITVMLILVHYWWSSPPSSEHVQSVLETTSILPFLFLLLAWHTKLKHRLATSSTISLFLYFLLLKTHFPFFFSCFTFLPSSFILFLLFLLLFVVSLSFDPRFDLRFDSGFGKPSEPQRLSWLLFRTVLRSRTEREGDWQVQEARGVNSRVKMPPECFGLPPLPPPDAHIREQQWSGRLRTSCLRRGEKRWGFTLRHSDYRCVNYSSIHSVIIIIHLLITVGHWLLSCFGVEKCVAHQCTQDVQTQARMHILMFLKSHGSKNQQLIIFLHKHHHPE